MSQSFGNTPNALIPTPTPLPRNPSATTRPVFPNQDNPIPIQFGGKTDPAMAKAIADAAAEKQKQDLAANDGFTVVGKGGKPKVDPSLPNTTSEMDGVSSVSLNSGYFASKNRGTISVAGGGSSVTISPNALGPNFEFAEKVMRRIAIDAVQDMQGLQLKDPPAVMGVLLAMGEMRDGSDTVHQGWQVYIHSSVKGDPPGGPRTQAVLHPKLKALIQNAGYVHHFSSMCAEMGLLSNYFNDNLQLVSTELPLQPLGKHIFMMTYVAGNFPPREDGQVEDGTGYYLVPCVHSDQKCGMRRNHSGTHGCEDVRRLLGVQLIGRGRPSEQDALVLREQQQREQNLPA